MKAKLLSFNLNGAKVNVVSDKVMQDHNIECHYKKTRVKLKSYLGHQIPPKRVVTVPCEYKGKLSHVKLHVVEIEAAAVLRAQT